MAETISGILLAGGMSRRMGRDKALMELRGERIAARLIRELRAVADEALIVGHAPERFAGLDARIIPDDAPGCGIVGGVAAGLRAMRGELGVVAGCDMPFLNARLFAHLIARVGGADGAILETADGLEPLCAVYHRRIESELRAMIREGDLAARRIAARTNLRRVAAEELRSAGIDPRRTHNMNTPEDAETAQRLALELIDDP